MRRGKNYVNRTVEEKVPEVAEVPVVSRRDVAVVANNMKDMIIRKMTDLDVLINMLLRFLF